MWVPWRRKPLSAKASGAYCWRMADINREQFVKGPAVPLSFTLSRHEKCWVVRSWYHGASMAEALMPSLVAERYLDPARVPLECSWEVVLRELAIAIEDLGQLRNSIVRTDTP